MTVHWVKAYIGIYGNEMADLLAKDGTKLQTHLEIPVSKAELNRQIDALINDEWDHQWYNRKDYRQTNSSSHILMSVNPKRS